MAVYEINAPPGSHEFIITRIFNAPRGIVFKTVTDPLLVPQWWGPRWFTTKVIKMVAMPGGTWRYIQTDKEGKEYGFHGVYHDVIIPERLIYTMEYDGMPGHVTLVIDKFTEQDGRTMMTSTTIFQSVEDRDQMLRWGMEEGRGCRSNFFGSPGDDADDYACRASSPAEGPGLFIGSF